MKNHAAECVQLIRRAAALLAGALALSLLAGCSGGGSQPVVTDDDLTPSSAVQTALDLEAGNGKTYAYVLDANDLSQISWEEAEAQAREMYEEAVRAAEEALAEAQAAGMEDLEDRKSYLNDLKSEDWLKWSLDTAKREWEKQQGLDPVVSPQEAANRAGWMFEETYGIDLTGKELVLTCWRTDSTGNPADGPSRVLWSVNVRYEDFDGNIYCDLDATTGEFVMAGYAMWTEEVNEQMLQCPRPDCCSEVTEGENTFLRYDPDDPSYPPLIESLKATVQQELSGSPLVDGASVTGIEASLVMSNQYIELYTTCDNGKTYLLRWDGNGANRIGFDYGGYPLQGYFFGGQT